MRRNGKPPKGWHAHRVDEVADVRFSSVDKKTVPAQRPIKLCNYMDVWKNPYIHNGLDFMKSSASESDIEKFSLQVDDVLLTKDSETKEEIAEPSVVREHVSDLVLGYHLALLRPNPDIANGQFLAAQLRIPEFRRQFVRAASGATRYGLGMKTVSEATVWLPDTRIQERISFILRSVDEAIEATRAVIEQTRRLKTALLQDLLTNGLPGRHREFKTDPVLGRLPHCWSVRRLKELTAETRQITYGIVQAGPHVDDGVPYIRVSDMQGRSLSVDGMLRTSNEIAATYKRSTVRECDVVFALRGDIGAVHIVTADLDGANLTQGTARISPGDGVDPQFLLWGMRAPNVLAVVERRSKGSTFREVSLAELEKIPFPLPAMDEQQEIASLLNAVECRLWAEEDALAQSIEVKTALSQGLLTGRIPVKGGT